MGNSYWMDSIIRFFDMVLGGLERSRQRRALGQLDERLLSDIGADRATAKTEADKPLWRD